MINNHHHKKLGLRKKIEVGEGKQDKKKADLKEDKDELEKEIEIGEYFKQLVKEKHRKKEGTIYCLQDELLFYLASTNDQYKLVPSAAMLEDKLFKDAFKKGVHLLELQCSESNGETPLKAETRHLAVFLWSKVLHSKWKEMQLGEPEKKKVLDFLMVCLLVATKIEEYYPMSVHSIVTLTSAYLDSKITVGEVILKECFIMEMVNFKVFTPPICSVVNIITHILHSTSTKSFPGCLLSTVERKGSEAIKGINELLHDPSCFKYDITLLAAGGVLWTELEDQGEEEKDGLVTTLKSICKKHMNITYTSNQLTVIATMISGSIDQKKKKKHRLARKPSSSSNSTSALNPNSLTIR